MNPHVTPTQTQAPARFASTLILFQAESYRILMVKRARQLAFFPNAWVFPGGRVDDDDALVATTGQVAGLSHNRSAVAPLRECFEEAGVWIGSGTPTSDLRQALNHRKASLKDHPELIANLSRLTLYSRWITPISEPKRYDTYFFLAQLYEHELVSPQADQSETVDSQWFSPKEAIELHQKGQMFLAPPTLITLIELDRYTSFADILQEDRDVRPIVPIHKKDKETDLEIILPGHPLHHEKEPTLMFSRLQLHRGVWRLD